MTKFDLAGLSETTLFERCLYSTVLLAGMCIDVANGSDVERSRAEADQLRDILNRGRLILLMPSEEEQARKGAADIFIEVMPLTDVDNRVRLMTYLCALTVDDNARHIGVMMSVTQRIAYETYGELRTPRLADASPELKPLVEEEAMWLEFMRFLIRAKLTVVDNMLHSTPSPSEVELSRDYWMLLRYYTGQPKSSSKPEELSSLLTQLQICFPYEPREAWCQVSLMCLHAPLTSVVPEQRDANCSRLIYSLLDTYPAPLRDFAVSN